MLQRQNNRNQELKPPFLIDTVLLSVILLLVIFSLIMIYSTTGTISTEKFGDSLFFVKRQAVAVLLGITSLYIISKFKVNIFRRYSPYLIFVIFVILGLTFIPGLAHSSGGARRWITLPFFNFQPAELSKVLYVVFLAGFFQRKQEKIGSFMYGVFLPLFFATSVAVVLLMQPDFGSSAIIVLTSLVMAISVGARLKHILLSGVPLVIAATILVITSPYRLKRILAFLSPEEDLLGRGYQLTQSLIAVSSGELTGLGIGKSMQKLHFLPAAHTDFIFAVIAEEFGLVGCVILMILFLVILWRGLAIAKRYMKDIFSYSLAIGMTTLLVVPALLNMGVVTGVLPTKGLVLPLIGYGGSSMICSLMCVGFLLALARHTYRNSI